MQANQQNAQLSIWFQKKRAKAGRRSGAPLSSGESKQN
jgi:hypothetical protein